MKTSGDLVGGGIEFTAGMQLGEHDLDGGHFFAIVQRHFVDRNAAAVIGDGDRIVDRGW